VKIARIVGLVAIAALAASVLFGAGSASAASTTLCKTATYSPYCEVGDRYSSNTAIEGTSTPTGYFRIKTEYLSVSCSSILKGETTATWGELPVSISKLSLAECSNGCTAEFKNMPYAGSLTQTTGSDGTLTTKSGGSGEPRIYAKCPTEPELVNCEWAVPSLKFEGSGSNPQISADETPLVSKGGSSCPKATLRVTYALSSPKPAYAAVVLPEHTRLCKVQESPCREANTYPPGTAIEATAANLKIALISSYIECKSATMKAETQVQAVEEPLPFPLKINSLTLNGCVWYGGIGSCQKVIVTNQDPGALIHLNIGNHEATLKLASEWEFVCGMAEYTCKVGVGAATVPFDYSQNPTAFVYQNMPLEVIPTPNGLCNKSSAKLTARFSITSPATLYVE
jgi:hypothetical protein